MKSRKLFGGIIVAAAVVLIISAGVIAVSSLNKSGGGTGQVADSFESCAAAGNPILESYPEQCTTKDGKHFTKKY